MTEEKTIEKPKTNLKFNLLPSIAEPKRAFRFGIKFEEIQIEEHLFRGYKLYNDGDKLIFETSFYEEIQNTLNPVDFFKIRNIKVSFLDPVGRETSAWSFRIDGMSFSNSGDYGTDELMTYKLKFEVNKKTFKII